MNRVGRASYMDRLLWKYGTRYAKSIRKIPFLKDVAERQYWRLAKPGGNTKHEIGRDFFYLGDYRALTRTVFGHKMFVDTKDIQVTPHLCLDGLWEPHITKVFMETIKEGMSIVEVGANIGYYTVLAASMIGDNGKIYSFEANPEEYKILYQNISVNGLLNRAVLMNKAVSNKSGRLKFHTLR